VGQKTSGCSTAVSRTAPSASRSHGQENTAGTPVYGRNDTGHLPRELDSREDARHFMQEIDYSGIVDMGYRYDRRDGKYKLLDVNPRVGATFRLFVDSNGMDVVRALHLNLTGQPVRSGRAREGRKWIVEQSDLATSLRYGRLGRLTGTEWACSLHGIEEAAWFARDDPLPFAAMWWSLLCAATFLKTRHRTPGRAGSEGLDRSADVVDELSARADEYLVREDNRQVRLRDLSRCSSA
jgi:hypothetical protein